jgi:hypothetical protein
MVHKQEDRRSQMNQEGVRDILVNTFGQTVWEGQGGSNVPTTGSTILLNKKAIDQALAALKEKILGVLPKRGSSAFGDDIGSIHNTKENSYWAGWNDYRVEAIEVIEKMFGEGENGLIYRKRGSRWHFQY